MAAEFGQGCLLLSHFEAVERLANLGQVVPIIALLDVDPLVDVSDLLIGEYAEKLVLHVFVQAEVKVGLAKQLLESDISLRACTVVAVPFPP